MSKETKDFTEEEKSIIITSLDNTIAGITDAILKTQDEARKSQLRDYLKKHQQVQGKFM